MRPLQLPSVFRRTNPSDPPAVTTPAASVPVHGAIAAALHDCRRAFVSVAVFSGVVNLLVLAGPLYMLQVYDRVLASRSVPTLVALTVFLFGAYAFQGILDTVRSRIVVRAATLLDEHLAGKVHDAVVRLSIVARRHGDAHEPVRDLDQIRAFLTGAGPAAVMDLPWIPVFLVICVLIHPWLGALSFVAAALLLGLTILTGRASRAPALAVSRDHGARQILTEATRRNGESAVAMAMTGDLAARWLESNRDYVSALARAADVVNGYGSLTRIVRLLVQSAVLGLGAYLVIRNELTAGAMIAASIMMGRALAPVESAIANWRAFQAARDSIRRLSQTLAQMPAAPAATTLPPPCRSLVLERVGIMPPASGRVVLANVQFRLEAGEALAVVGPSASGKTSLARTLVGAWPAAQGIVRIDGAALDQWRPGALGRHVGYVSQAIDLFDGTVAENIARMSPHPDSAALLKAAQAAGAHDMILRLPSGYDTRIGDAGSILSAGQRQRIALARALYGDPFLVVLDEPNANLDADGEAALLQAVSGLKARGAIVVIVAHRPEILAPCDKMLVLGRGTQLDFGDRAAVLARALRRPMAQTAPAQAAPLPPPSVASAAGQPS